MNNKLTLSAALAILMLLPAVAQTLDLPSNADSQPPIASPATAAGPDSAPTSGHTGAGGTMPSRGMTMRQVEQYYGAPRVRRGAVGNPPITRWEYDGFIVYFEHRHVIHSVAKIDR